MSRTLAALLVLLALAGAAHALGIGKEGLIFGRMGIASGGGHHTSQPTGDILLVDGVSLLLQTDAASFVCRAGGC